MVFNNVLNVDYQNTLRFRHLGRIGFETDLSLPMSGLEAVSLLKDICDIIRQGTMQKDIVSGNYEISVASYSGTAISITIVNVQGSMSKPVGMFKYDKFVGNKSILSGLESAIKDIEFSAML